MVRKCKRCADCAYRDGDYFCEVDKAKIDPESLPRFEAGKCWRKAEARTPSEISEMRSEFGRRGGLKTRKNKRPRMPKTQVQVHKFDHEVLMKYARLQGMTIVNAVHHLMRVILQNHSDKIKKPNGWIDDLGTNG